MVGGGFELLMKFLSNVKMLSTNIISESGITLVFPCHPFVKDFHTFLNAKLGQVMFEHGFDHIEQVLVRRKHYSVCLAKKDQGGQVAPLETIRLRGSDG